jgi:hypothetical protein
MIVNISTLLNEAARIFEDWDAACACACDSADTCLERAEIWLRKYRATQDGTLGTTLQGEHNA